MSDSLACVICAGALRQALFEFHDRTLAQPGVDREMVHEATGADEAKTHAALRAIVAVENAVQIGDAVALVADADAEALRRPRGSMANSARPPPA